MYSQQFSRGQLPRLDSQYWSPSDSSYAWQDARALQSQQLPASSTPRSQQPGKLFSDPSDFCVLGPLPTPEELLEKLSDQLLQRVLSKLDSKDKSKK